jgi:hypothetical protein
MINLLTAAHADRFVFEHPEDKIYANLPGPRLEPALDVLLDVHGHAPAHRLGVVPGAPEQQQRHQPKHQRSLARALFNGQCLRLAGNAPASAASSPRRQSALPWPQHTGRQDGPVGLEHDHQQCDRGHQEVKDGDDHGDAPYGRTGVGLHKPAAQPAGPGPANRLPRRTGRSAPQTAGLRHPSLLCEGCAENRARRSGRPHPQGAHRDVRTAASPYCRAMATVIDADVGRLIYRENRRMSAFE